MSRAWEAKSSAGLIGADRKMSSARSTYRARIDGTVHRTCVDMITAGHGYCYCQRMAHELKRCRQDGG